MNNTYISEFKKAIDNTLETGVENPITDYIDVTHKFLTEDAKQDIQDLFNENIFNDINNRQLIIGGCARVSSLMKPLLEEYFDEEIFLTIGYVEIIEDKTEDEWFHTPINQLINDVKKEKRTMSANLHIWLTLPSLEFIDFTLPSTTNKILRIENPISNVIFYSDNKSDSIKLHPQLIGEEVCSKLTYVITEESNGDKKEDFKNIRNSMNKYVTKNLNL